MSRSGGDAVLLLDLDDFKDVNDTLGHDAGDTLLRTVGRRLRTAAPDGVARLGGDEFALLLENVTQEEAHQQALLLAASVGLPVMVGSVRVRTSASVGIVMVAEHAADTNAALRHADLAMYAVKAARTVVEVYRRPEAGLALARKLALAGDLPQAVRAHEFEVFFQPQADARTERVVGAEALLRWTHPTYGPVPPPKVIDLAQHVGCLRQLTDAVMALALTSRAAWAAGGTGLDVSVNVTVADGLDATLPGTVAELLTRTGTRPAPWSWRSRSRA